MTKLFTIRFHSSQQQQQQQQQKQKEKKQTILTVRIDSCQKTNNNNKKEREKKKTSYGISALDTQKPDEVRVGIVYSRLAAFLTGRLQSVRDEFALEAVALMGSMCLAFDRHYRW